MDKWPDLELGFLDVENVPFDVCSENVLGLPNFSVSNKYLISLGQMLGMMFMKAQDAAPPLFLLPLVFNLAQQAVSYS